MPQGTVTFLFTDIEGSTELARRLGADFASLRAEHRRVLREAFSTHDGHEIDTAGDGFFVVFERAVRLCAPRGRSLGSRSRCSSAWDSTRQSHI